MLKNKKLWTYNFGSNLRRVMSELGVTQRELSRRTEMRQSTISAYINGDYTPSITSVIAMAQALGVEYFVLLDVDGDVDIRTCERDTNDIISEEEWLSDFAWWLSFVIKSENISQRYLSELTGISQGLISKYISAKTIPSAYSVVRIAEELAYNDDYEDLLNYGFVSINRHY